MSMLEVYLLTRLLHLDAFYNTLFFVGGIFSIVFLISSIIIVVDPPNNVKDAEKLRNTMGIIGLPSLFLGSVLCFLSIGSKTELAAIIAIPAASEMLDSETIGEEAKEWNDIMQDITKGLIDDGNVEELINEELNEDE